MGHYKGWTAAALIFGVSEVVLELLIPMLMSTIVDGGLYREDTFMLQGWFSPELIANRNRFVLTVGAIMVGVACLSMAMGVLAAICIGRKLAHGPQELRNHCKASGTVTIMAGAFFALAALARLAVGLTGIGTVVRAVLEVLCAVWLVLLGRKWLRPDGQLPAKSMASGIWGTLVFYWCVLSRFMENSSSWHRVSPTVMVWEMLAVLLFLSSLVRALWLPET